MPSSSPAICITKGLSLCIHATLATGLSFFFCFSPSLSWWFQGFQKTYSHKYIKGNADHKHKTYANAEFFGMACWERNREQQPAQLCWWTEAFWYPVSLPLSAVSQYDCSVILCILHCSVLPRFDNTEFSIVVTRESQLSSRIKSMSCTVTWVLTFIPVWLAMVLPVLRRPRSLLSYNGTLFQRDWSVQEGRPHLWYYRPSPFYLWQSPVRIFLIP